MSQSSKKLSGNVCKVLQERIEKIDEQIQLAANKGYTPTQRKWVAHELRNQRKFEVAKRIKRSGTASVDGKTNVLVLYVSKLLKFAEDRSTIQFLSSCWGSVAHMPGWWHDFMLIQKARMT